MKQAYKITFEGFEFFIDEDARIVFFEFIEQTEKKIGKEEEKKQEWAKLKLDILAKIKDSITDPSKVLTLAELEIIIDKVCGTTSFDAHEGRPKQSSALIRDVNSSVIAGVCAGIANLLSTNVSIIRLLFIVLGIFTFPVGEIIYLVLWVVIPSNKSQDEKENNVKVEKIRSVGDESPLHVIGETVSKLFIAFWSFLGAVFKSIFGLIGLAFILFGVFIILGFFDIWPWHFVPDFHYNSWVEPGYWSFNEINTTKLLLLICAAFLISIPILGLIYALIKAIFGIEKRNNVLRYSFMLIWFLCLLVTIGLLITKDDFNNKNNVGLTSSLSKVNSSMIYIETTDNLGYNHKSLSNNMDMFKYGYMDRYGDDIIFGMAEIEIEHADIEDAFELIVDKKAAFVGGGSEYTIHGIEYNWRQQDSLLILDKYFYSSEMHWWNFPEVKVTIVVPRYMNVLFKEPRN